MEKWRQIDELFHAAAECPPHERAAFLDEACGGDEELRREVESLLAADSAAEEMETAKLPAQVAAEMIGKQSPRIVSGQMLNQYRIISPLARAEWAKSSWPKIRGCIAKSRSGFYPPNSPVIPTE